MIFDLSRLTQVQREITEEALRRCSFDFELLRSGLKEQTGRDAIPVEWADLSRHATEAHAVAEGNEHDHEDEHLSGHIDVWTDGGRAHGIAARGRVLGLAWYSGKVSVDASLEGEPELAGEVLLSEAAHMTDFFWITPEQRACVFAIFHGDDNTLHDHGWFEESGNEDYWSWVGEAFMAGFLQAFTDYEPTLTGFHHAATEDVGRRIRELLQPAPSNSVFGMASSSVFHDRHYGIAGDLIWPSSAQAAAAGRRPCRVCRPA